MQACIDLVRAFRERFDLSRECDVPINRDVWLVDIGTDLLHVSESLEQLLDSDSRYLRAHLLIEELGEFLLAYGEGDEVKALDGLCDLLYVLLGTAITHRWPLVEAFAEVHASNMTKQRKSDDTGRMRDKGDSFQPPKIAEILAFAKEHGVRPMSVMSALDHRLRGMQSPAFQQLTPPQRTLINTLCEQLANNNETVQRGLEAIAYLPESET